MILNISIRLDLNDQIQFDNGADVIIGSDNTDAKIKGKLVRRDPILDRNSQSLKVYVAFSNFSMIPDFLSGNYVNVKIKGKKLENSNPLEHQKLDEPGLNLTK